MPMSDELREYAIGWDEGNRVRRDLVAIADRIDAAHQKAEDEWKAKDGKSWIRGYAECRAELLEGSEAIAASLEDAGWVKLPVSGDGETIHVGDVMDGYGKTIEVVEMRYGRSGWVLISRDGSGYADTFAFRHHRAPTVEDVLREFGIDWECSADGEDKTAVLKEYAAKFRLAGDAE